LVNFSEKEYEALSHIGIARRSGRYPWGSGKDPYQRSVGFKKFIDECKAAGMTQRDMADVLEGYANKGTPKGSPGYQTISTADVRAGISSSTAEVKAANISMATNLSKKGLSNRAIAKRMLGNESKESTVRGWLENSEKVVENSLHATAQKLREELNMKPFLDVGKGTWLYMGVTKTKLDTALAMLQDEGYKIHAVKVPQLGTDKMTNLKILTKADKAWSDAQQAVKRGEYYVVASQSDDGGLTYSTPKALPVSVSGHRLSVRYAEDGGTAMDGVIQIRRGVEDLDLGQARYAQVRVAIDGSHYLKGMAMYADDLPAGVDMRFNTNKSNTGNKLDAMKPLKTKPDGSVDPASPFGATVHPRTYVDKKGKTQTSPLNIVYEEGDWDKWSRSLSSQMLSKQPVQLATRQLGLAHLHKQDELDAIMSLTNPVVKKQLLDEFAESADAAAVHLKAASIDRQANNVILPMNSVRPHEVYAPNLTNGTKVALVRHPHGGPFEIPSLTVNNKNAEAKRILGNAMDAIGIHHSVASQLSGADFDGDTVLVIPNDTGQIRHRAAIEKLATFDPKEAYPKYEGMHVMTKQNTQTEMGKISNLITDMTILGADQNEIARAIKHSMVVIDAEKHELNYKQSAIDNGIADLKKRYQGGAAKGAATLISRASSDDRIPKQKPRSYKDGGPVDPKTGEKVFTRTGDTYVKTTTKVDKRTGVSVTKSEVVEKTTKGTKMEFVKDARELLSGPKVGPFETRGTPMERAYASHANQMKSLANQARKESVALTMPKVSSSAKAVYAKEVASLNAKLKIAQQNAPLERRAQVLGNAMARQRIDDNPGWDKDDVKRAKYQSLDEGRRITDANKVKVHIEDREWEAIQAGAVAHSRLSEILNNADPKRVRELATPRARTSLTPGQLARAKQMQAQGRALSDVADALGIPRSTIVDNLNR
jgi:hypothetical protein